MRHCPAVSDMPERQRNLTGSRTRSDGSGGIIVGSDEQLGLDLGVPVEQTEWGKWVDPHRRKEQVRRFLDRAGLRTIPAKAWPEGAPELTQLDGVVAELFPDLATAMAPENADMADAFI